MKLDLLNDLIILWGFKVHLTTVIGWLSGVVGLYANYRQMRKLANIEDAKVKDKAMKELAERCYYKIERVAALTPSKLDDKLLSYMKLAFEAYKTKFSSAPSKAEVKELIAHAEHTAEKTKIRGKK